MACGDAFKVIALLNAIRDAQGSSPATSVTWSTVLGSSSELYEIGRTVLKPSRNHFACDRFKSRCFMIA
jgi:hypothetical protein